MSDLRLYFLGKYARTIRWKIFLNLSRPNPIITAANVPPKTTIRGGIRNSFSKAPPSIKNAPKIEKIPSRSPLIVENFLLIYNSTKIELKPSQPFYKSSAKEFPDFEDP